jgi:MFS family permease
MGLNPAGLLIIRSMHGLGIGTVFAGIPVVVSQWFPAKERGIVIGLTSGAAPLGAAIGTSFVPAIMQATGSWQLGVSWAAAFPFVSCLLAIVAIVGPQPPNKDARPGPPGGGPGGPGGPAGSWADAKVALLLPVTWAAAACCFFASWELRTFNSVAASYLSVQPPVGVGLGAMKAGVAMSSVQFAGLAGSMLGGFIVEKIFRGRIRPVVILCFVLSAVSYVAIRFSVVYTNHALLTACLWGVAFSLAVIGPQIMGFVAKNYPPQVMGKIGGAFLGNANTIGGLLGAGIASYTISKTGFYTTSFNVYFAAAVVGLLCGGAMIAPKIFAQWAAERVPGGGPGGPGGPR